MLDNKKIKIIKNMLYHLSNDDLVKSEVIQEGAPVISFGKTSISKIATMGLNPSDQEFYGKNGIELTGINRRFHTLNSLGIKSWKDVTEYEIEKILVACEEYFFRNPYDRWFKPLNNIISGTGTSYYDAFNSACHLDLVPYATKTKWGDLSERQKKHLLEIGSNFLADIINDGAIQVIILNGKSVVKNLEEMIGFQLNKKEYKSWSLPRADGCVRGEAYKGTIEFLGDNKLDRPIKILGYNHNIQSSFGVTNETKNTIKIWLTREIGRL